MTKRSPFRYFKTSPEIIRLAVMLYVRFPPSLRNNLGAILRFVAGKQNPDFLSEAEALDNLLSQKSLVAGAGFEPATFRL